MNSLIKSMLPDPPPETVNGIVNALRSIMHALAFI